MQGHSEIAELERRITSALEQIGAGLDALAAASPAPDTAAEPQPPSEAEAKPQEQAIAANRRLQARIQALEAELSESKAANQTLSDELKAAAAREADAGSRAASDARMEKMTRQLDVQGLELQRMRKSTVQLREHLRVLHEAAAGQLAEPQMINKAMLAELESLRATRHSETAEMDEILAEMMPLIQEARSNG